MDTLRETVKGFIVKNFYVSETASLPDDTSLLDAGIVDSTGVLEVASFLEREFGIVVDDVDLIPENLDTIRAIAAFIERKKR